MFVQLKFNVEYYGQNNLFLLKSVRLRAIVILLYQVLANWAAWFTTGLFLFVKPLKNGLLYFRDVYHRKREFEIRSLFERQGRGFFRRQRRRIWIILYYYKRRMGDAKNLYRWAIREFTGVTSISLMEAAGPTLSRNRLKGVWEGTTIPPKSLLNLLPRTATLSGESLCRYSQRPNATEVS